jgi:hypothetical protein
MSPLWPLLALVATVPLAWISAARAVRDAGLEDLRESYRGAEVAAVLGGSLVRAGGWAAFLALGLALLAGTVRAWPVAVVVLAGTVVLAWVGRLDDRSASRERGMVAHMRSLLRGRVTTGILKLVAGGAAAVAVAVAHGGETGRVVLAALVIALAVNVTNALDVRPGRALKWALLALLAVWPVLRARDLGLVLVASSYLGAGVVVAAFDLRERGMLGDAGSNPLGLVVGSGMAVVLPTWGLAVALVVLLGLQVAAESVTISRLIDAVPPIRWFDRLGRKD